MFDSLFALAQAVDEAVEKGHDLDAPLAWIREHVQRIITEPLCTSHVLGSELLDQACMAVGAHVFEKLTVQQEQTPAAKNREGACYVYLVTKVQKSGGHTKVIQEYIRARPQAQHHVLSTELDGPSDQAYFLDFAASAGQVQFEKVGGKNFLRQLENLQSRLIQLQPDKTYLFNHHQDSVIASCVVPQMGLDAYFCHHADHHLCLGVHLRHLKHIDMHPMGYNHCRLNLKIDNLYVPLAVPDLGPSVRVGADRVPNRKLVTCTAGRSNKLEVPYFVRYVDMVPRMLEATGGTHIHIGQLSRRAIERIRQGVRDKGLPADSFAYIPWVPSVWKSLIEHQVDVYIASFPYGGGLTLLEAMGAGVPVVLHQHLFSEILSGLDLAYESAFSWRYPQELLDHLKALSPIQLANERELARAEFENFYDSRCLPKFLTESDEKPVVPRSPSGRYRVAVDEWGYWMERQPNLGHLASRWAFRIFKNLRSYWYR